MTIRARKPSASICLPVHGIVGIGPRHHVCVLCSVLLHYFRDCYFVSSSFGLPPQRKMRIERLTSEAVVLVFEISGEDVLLEPGD